MIGPARGEPLGRESLPLFTNLLEPCLGRIPGPKAHTNALGYIAGSRRSDPLATSSIGSCPRCCH